MKQGALDLKRSGVSVDVASDVILNAAAGLKRGRAHTAESYRSAVLSLCRLTMVGLAATPDGKKA